LIKTTEAVEPSTEVVEEDTLKTPEVVVDIVEEVLDSQSSHSDCETEEEPAPEETPFVAPATLTPAIMAEQKTAEIDEAVSVAPSEASASDDRVSSTGSDSFDLTSEDYVVDFPELAKYKKTEREQSQFVDVCYKPVYKTLKKLQMRSGPGSKFPANGVVPANTLVRVISEGLDARNHKLIKQWWELHVTHGAAILATPSKRALKSLRDFESWDDWAEEFGFERSEIDSLKRHVGAANNKVKIAVEIEGEEVFGWISRRKKSSPAIKRVFAHGGKPVVQISELRGLIKRNSLFVDAVRKYESANAGRMPKLDLYRSILKKVTGCVKVEWEGAWRQSRSRGSELITLGNGVVRTGYYLPEDTAYVIFSSISKANNFIKNANKKLNDERVQVEFEFNFANLQTVTAIACTAEWTDYCRRLREYKVKDGESVEEFKSRTKRSAGIYTKATL